MRTNLIQTLILSAMVLAGSVPAQDELAPTTGTTQTSTTLQTTQTTQMQGEAPIRASRRRRTTLAADEAATTVSTEAGNAQGEAPALRISPDGRMRFNFKGVPLDTVLDYLSREAGFIIIKSTSIEGQVDLISHQPITREDAVALLNTVLNEKGYAAIRNGRTLTIVTRNEAKQRDIPVRVGNEPDTIPKSDEMITQVIPLRYAKAEELVSSIRDLLPSYATISFNASSNAIVLTDTQTSVRRITEVVKALDGSISAISTLRVFNLQHADSKETANLITTLFAPQQTGNRQGNQGGGGFPFPGFFGGGGRRGGDGGGDQPQQPDSAALQAATRVVAAADERTNSVVVAAPENIMATIEELIRQVDSFTEMGTEVRVYTLQHADATEMATNLTAVFAQARTGAAAGQGGQRGGGGGFMQRMMAAAQSNQTALSQRRQAATTVLVQPDTRTNSVIVSAVSEVMEQISDVIAQLDQNSAKTKRVYTYSVKNADPQQVTTMLQSMFGSGATGTNRARSNTNANNVRGSSNQRNSNSNRNNSNSSSNSGFGNSSFGR